MDKMPQNKNAFGKAAVEEFFELNRQIKEGIGATKNQALLLKQRLNSLKELISGMYSNEQYISGRQAMLARNYDSALNLFAGLEERGNFPDKSLLYLDIGTAKCLKGGDFIWGAVDELLQVHMHPEFLKGVYAAADNNMAWVHAYAGVGYRNAGDAEAGNYCFEKAAELASGKDLRSLEIVVFDYLEAAGLKL